MINQNMLKGTGVALVTPFTQNLEIDYVAYKKLLQHVCKHVNYFVVHGTTGESSTTTLAEKNAILKFIVKHNIKNLPIVCGVGGNNTAVVIQNIKGLCLDYVSALLVVTPYYNKPTQEGIYQHYKKIAACTPIPIILYNVPSRTGVNIHVNTIVRLSALEQIIGIKEASGDLLQCIEIAHKIDKDFLLISGDDMLTLPMIAIGAVGTIAVLANALPICFNSMVQYALQGNFSCSKQYTYYLYMLHKLMYKEGNPVGIKQLLHMLNICNTEVRLPLVKGSSTLYKNIQEVYDNMSNLIKK